MWATHANWDVDVLVIDFLVFTIQRDISRGSNQREVFRQKKALLCQGFEGEECVLLPVSCGARYVARRLQYFKELEGRSA
jgi:hypothetical protein